MLKDNIKLARKRADLTQEELGLRIGVKKQTVQKYENGIITNVPGDKLEAIASACGVTPMWLMGWGEVVEPEELSDAEAELITLFRQVPADKQSACIEFVRSALKMSGLLRSKQ